MRFCEQNPVNWELSGEVKRDEQKAVYFAFQLYEVSPVNTRTAQKTIREEKGVFFAHLLTLASLSLFSLSSSLFLSPLVSLSLVIQAPAHKYHLFSHFLVSHLWPFLAFSVTFTLQPAAKPLDQI